MNFLTDQWNKYRRKKTRLGIIFDFVFTGILIAMLFPGSRRSIMSTFIRLSMFQPHETEEIIYIDQREYDWQLETIDGQKVNLNDFRGKTIFLNLWATWCPPCLAEMPSIQKLYDQYKDNVAFVMVSNEDSTTLQKFIQKQGYTFPVYKALEQVPQSFYSRNIPATYLISPQGQLLIKKKGAANWHGEKVQELINKTKSR